MWSRSQGSCGGRAAGDHPSGAGIVGFRRLPPSGHVRHGRGSQHAGGETNPYLNSSGSFFFGGGRNINQRFAVEVEYTHNWLAVDPVVIERA
jgi:hypothetical protein